MKSNTAPISVRSGQMEFLKLNAARNDWRDVYSWILSRTWPQFVGLVLSYYLVINCVFGALYMLGKNTVAEMPPGSFGDAFFFSVETLATVGYGHMYPQSLYGHIVVTAEIVAGMFMVAVLTGLIFVRFSRPMARLVFSDALVIAPFDGKPALAMRVANMRDRTMVEAEFRIMYLRNEPIAEGEEVRRFYTLKLHFDRLIVFPAALTIRHTIDETSPLHGETIESMRKSDARFFASINCIETVIPAAVQSFRDYTWQEVKFGHRFVEIYAEDAKGRILVDYARIHHTEPAPETGFRE